MEQQEQRALEIGIIGSTIVNVMCEKKITVDQFLGRDRDDSEVPESDPRHQAYLAALGVTQSHG